MVSSKDGELRSVWRKSSQAAANLYNNGSKLWTKEDLRDIEHQLENSENQETFRVRLIDDTVVSVENIMFGEESPIW